LLCEDGSDVHAEKFGKILEWFGPYKDDGNPETRTPPRSFLNRIDDAVSEKWFHGMLSRQDAEERLSSKKKTSIFLVRISPKVKQGFILSSIDKDQTKQHRIITYHSSGLFVLPDETFCNTLADAVAALRRIHKLRHICPGSRFVKHTQEQNQHPLSLHHVTPSPIVKEEIKRLQYFSLMHTINEQEIDCLAAIDNPFQQQGAPNRVPRRFIFKRIGGKVWVKGLAVLHKDKSTLGME